MASAKFPAWRRDKSSAASQQLRNCVGWCFVAMVASLVALCWVMFSRPYAFCKSQQGILSFVATAPFEKIYKPIDTSFTSLEFDCIGSVQTGPVVAHRVEKLQYPFFISIADLGTVEKPNRNFQRVLKGKLFQRPAISETIQSVLEKLKTSGFAKGKSSIVDVGANVGMATFAAAAMGYSVLAFEPVLENVHKLCDGIHLNRASSLVKLFHYAVSDSHGSITMHKVVGRLDNSAVSATGAKLAFKSSEVVPINISTVALDSLLPSSVSVLLLKVDVQGWEYHVLKGASKLLSKPPHEAPYVIYEEDERLLQESNSTSQEILQFLANFGYQFCVKQGGDRHCAKENLW